MRANRYSKTVRRYGAKSSKKKYNDPRFNSSQYTQIPKSRKNKRTKKIVSESIRILARIYLFILILFVIMILALVLL